MLLTMTSSSKKLHLSDIEETRLVRFCDDKLGIDSTVPPLLNHTQSKTLPRWLLGMFAAVTTTRRRPRRLLPYAVSLI